MIAAQFSDPKNARIIFMAAGGLLVLAIALVVATILWWRSSGVEPAALAPLEVMSTRQWWDGDDDSRRELLEEVRSQVDVAAAERASSGGWANDVIDEQRAEPAPSRAPAPRPQPSVQSRLDRLEQMGQAAASPAASPAPAAVAAPVGEVFDDGGFGLFDQFAEDPFDEPVPQAEPQGRGKAKRKRTVEADDLWDSPSDTPRRPVDPLLNDGDFW